jgi:hypothetical protein
MRGTIIFMSLFAKADQANLTAAQKTQFKKLINALKGEHA